MHDSISGFDITYSCDICIKKKTCVTGNAILSNPEPFKQIIQVV